MRRLVLTLVLAFGGCDAQPIAPSPKPPTPSIETSRDTLSLRAVMGEGGELVGELHYQRRPDQAAPRMMELWLDIGDGLAFSHADALAAATAAGKDVIVQRHGTSLRVIVYASTNLSTLESGPLARLVFTRATGTDLTLTLAPRLPIFAPAAANDGLVLGAPLDLAGGHP